nr:phosphate signaling complex protein PhoU [candidate division Zixibacteria bacterium]
MTIHLRKEIDRLKQKVLSLSAHVEQAVHDAVKSISERDEELAARTMENDKTIDQMEVEVEEECLKILALHQPVANDLRFIIAVLKINNDLERIGDQAVNIARGALYLSKHEPVEMPFDLSNMADKVKLMLKRSIDSLVNLNAGEAHEISLMDDEIDDLHHQMYGVVERGILSHPERIECLIQFLSASRQLERIADHATNIAEDVIYMIEGEIFRHRMQDFKA